MAIKNHEINNLTLKKDDEKYGIKHLLNEKVKNKYENNMIYNNFLNILPNIKKYV